MLPVSPFSLFEGLLPAAKMVGSIAGELAGKAKDHDAPPGAFATAFSKLDANDDGRLNGADLVGHAVGLRDSVLEGIAEMLGKEPGRDSENAGASANGPRNGGQAEATHAMPPGQILLAGAAPALPSAPAARAVENLPGVAEIRATYLEMSQIH